MVHSDTHGVPNGSRKTNRKALQQDDCVFVSLICAVPFLLYGAVCGAYRYQSKRAGMFPGRLAAPKTV